MRLPRLSLRQIAAATALVASVSSLAVAAVHLMVDVTGKWAVSVDVNGMPVESVATFKQTGDSLSGTISGEMIGSNPITGRVSKDTIRFGATVDIQGQSVTLRFAGLIRDSLRIDGEIDVPQMGVLPFTAKKM